MKDKYPNINEFWAVIAEDTGQDPRPLDIEATCVGMPKEELQKIEKMLGALKEDETIDFDKWPWLVRMLHIFIPPRISEKL